MVRSRVAALVAASCALPILVSAQVTRAEDGSELASPDTTQPSTAVIPSPEATPGTIDVIVTYKQGVDVEHELDDLGPVEVEHVFDSVLNGAAVTVTASDLAVLMGDPAVARVEGNSSVHTTEIPWGLDRIDQTNLPLSRTFGPRPNGSGVRAYVIDTGVSPHPEFGARLESGASIFPDGSGDCNGHGTHVAGTIAGSTVGVAPGATIVPVRVLGCNGTGSVGDTISGLIWAVDDMAGHPGQLGVINLSLGGSLNRSLNDAVEAAVDSGMTVVVAAGNSRQDACNTSPASAASAITVAASAIDDSRASFSNHGSCVDIFAPGVDITSTWPGGEYATLSGTSMASPHVAGAVAILASQQPGATPASLTVQILGSATSGVVKGITRTTTTVNKLVCVAPVSSMSLATVDLPVAMVGSALNVSLSPVGSSGPHRWRVIGGRLPEGVTLSSDGTLSGMSRRAGTAVFSIALSNNSCQSVTQQLTLRVVAALTLSTQRVGEGRVGSPYSATLSASGGIGGYTWELIAGALPRGLTLSSSGQITGTPDSRVTASFTIRLRSGNFVVSKNVAVRIR